MMYVNLVCFFKQKTAYEMRISDWSSDVCSSDLSTGVDFRIFSNAGGIPENESAHQPAWPFLAIVGELFLGRAAMFSGIGEVAGIISGLLHHPGKKPSGRRMSSHETFSLSSIASITSLTTASSWSFSSSLSERVSL